MKMKYFVGVVIAIVVVAIGVGLWLTGSPSKARARRFDDLRLQHLQQIQSELLSFWQTKNKLPDALPQLHDDILGVNVPVDPETGAAYEYQKKGSEQFTLCATFALSSDERKLNPKETTYPIYGPYGPYIREQNWDHQAGRQCFDRTIDKERYQQDQKLRPAPVY